jgi:hypothetical protein
MDVGNGAKEIERIIQGVEDNENKRCSKRERNWKAGLVMKTANRIK